MIILYSIITNNDVLQPSSNDNNGGGLPPKPTPSALSVSGPGPSATSTAPNASTSTAQVANGAGHQPLPRGSLGASEVESQGNDADAAVRRRMQVLTKDELKDLLKARNLAGPGVNKSNKDGEYSVFIHIRYNANVYD